MHAHLFIEGPYRARPPLNPLALLLHPAAQVLLATGLTLVALTAILPLL